MYRIDVKGAKGGGFGEDGVTSYQDDRVGAQGAHVWAYFTLQKVCLKNKW